MRRTILKSTASCVDQYRWSPRRLLISGDLAGEYCRDCLDSFVLENSIIKFAHPHSYSCYISCLLKYFAITIAVADTLSLGHIIFDNV